VFQLVYRVPEYRLKWSVIDKLNTAVNRRFAEEGINFAYPTRTMYLRKLDDATV
jgi:small-conductance mechanosensitive channel